MADQDPVLMKSPKTETKDVPPNGLSEEESAFFLTKYLYLWISPLFDRGWERNKNKEIIFDKDLLHVPKDEDAEQVFEDFKVAWAAELERVAELKKAAPTVEAAAMIEPKLFTVLMKLNAKSVILSGILRAISDGLGVAAPFFLRELITWLGYQVFAPHLTHTANGYIWSVVLAVNQILISITNNASLFHVQKAFCNMRTATALAVYDKSTRLDAHHGITGYIQQMHASDSYKFVEMSLFLHQLWAAPLIIIAALISLYYFIGWAGVLALGVILVLTPIQGVVAGKMMFARSLCVGRADKRIEAVNEIMQGIRIVKFMGWEERFKERVQKIRETEIALFGTLFATRSVMVIMITYLPMLVSFFVFVVAYKGFDFNINPASVFPALAMLNVLRMPLTMLPMGIGKLVDLLVSVSRIRSFLSREDKVNTVQHGTDRSGPYAVEMKNATVQYLAEEQVTLPNGAAATIPRKVDLMKIPSLNILRGKLTLIVGATGSGKSTLMNAMIGESYLSGDSDIKVNGEIAYITQEAWIMNATLRENILCGKDFDHEKYLAAINDCQLVADFQQLPASDLTEIGERGVNVSGGQKQRIAFARAVYSGRDIVLMDDPLSAVDSHVCVALFEDCIVGALKDRTRVLVTHQVQFLPSADRIVVVDHGNIVFDGTYEDLEKSTVDVVTILAEASPTSSKRNAEKEQVPDDVFAAASPQESVGGDASPRVVHEEPKRVRATEIPAPDHAEMRKLMTIEHQEQGSIGSNVIGWYFRIQGPIPVFLSFFFFVLWRAVSVVSDMMVSWWSARTPVLDRPLSQDQYLLWYGLFTLFTGLCLFIRQIPFVMGMLNAARSSNSRMIHSLLHAPTSFFDTTPTGRVISRFSKDMEQMDIMIPESLNFFYNLVLVILGAYAVMIYSAYYLCIILVVVGIVFFFMYSYYTTTNRAQKRLEATNRSPMASVMNETLGGLPTIRAYGMTNDFVEKHYAKVRLSSRSIYSWRNSQRWLSIRVDAISAIISAATALLACGLLTSYDRTQQLSFLPIMSLAITYSIAIGGAFGFLTTMTAELESAMSSVERVKEYCDELPQERTVEYGTGPDDVPEPPANWPEHGSIEFRNSSLRYRDGLPMVLKNLSLTIQAGHKIGIVGRTGSGKSTIMLALFRMVELAEGALFFDGVDISKVKMEDLRSKITIIPQDPMLFQGTIRSNLDPFNLSTDDEVWGVLDRVGMSERVRRDGVGLECTVSEKGSNFSVGQRQLLCLARALLKQCKILLLDEATASVDFDADAMIQRTIRNEFKNCTVLTIAHRLATVIDSDRIVLLEHGVLMEYDSPAALLRDENSKFNSMVSRLGNDLYAQLKEQAIAAEKKNQ